MKDLNNIPSRRLRVLHVPEQAVLSILFRAEQTPEWVSIAKPGQIPETAKVVAMFPDYSRQSIAFLLEDDSFDEVEEGVQAPTMTTTWEWKRVLVNTAETEKGRMVFKSENRNGRAPDGEST